MYNSTNYYMLSRALKTGDAKEILPKKNRKKIKAMYNNNYVFQNTFNRLVGEYLGDDDYENLGPGMTSRQIKLSMLYFACNIFTDRIDYNGKKMPGIYSVSGYPSGKGWNINGDPLSAWICSMFNGKIVQEVDLYIPGTEQAPLIGKGITEDMSPNPHGVIVWANEMRYPPIWTVLWYALVITDSLRTLDISRFWLKRPVIFTADKELMNSINEIINDMEDNEEYTIASMSMSKTAQATQMLNTNVNGQNLQDVTGLIEWYESKYREWRGIDNNAQMDKKGENLITQEITVNDQYQRLNVVRNCRIIDEGLKTVNELFGTKITHVSHVQEDNEKNQTLEEQTTPEMLRKDAEK